MKLKPTFFLISFVLVFAIFASAAYAASSSSVSDGFYSYFLKMKNAVTGWSVVDDGGGGGGSCTPSCTGSLCGQSDGCGGVCPSSSVGTGCRYGGGCGGADACGYGCGTQYSSECGQCGNAACCIASCTGDQCGQGNGCGGYCSSADKWTAGKCGNPAACVPSCAGKYCGESDNCGGTCGSQTGEGCPCNDGSACTTGEVWVAGSCAGTAVTCSDNNPCTSDSCNPATGCGYTNVADGTGCGTGKACKSGSCQTIATTPAISCSYNPDGCDSQLDCANSITCDCDSECASGYCNPTSGSCATLCTPSCTGEQCGQGNGCGGSCPSTDKATPGKCGNSLPSKCGNGVVDAGELCDGNAQSSKCLYDNSNCGGWSMRSCTSSCTWSSVWGPCSGGANCGACGFCDAGSCEKSANCCGNGIVDAGEECEGSATTSNGCAAGFEKKCVGSACSYGSCQLKVGCDNDKDGQIAKSCGGNDCNDDAGAGYAFGSVPDGSKCLKNSECCTGYCNLMLVKCGKGSSSDPCAGITCNTPPASKCSFDGLSLITYSGTGTCNAGQCSYQSSTTICPLYGCENGACASAPIPKPVPAALSIPVLRSPADGSSVTSLTPALSWDSVPGAQCYSVNVINVGNWLTSSPSYSVPAGTLTAGKSYQWRVMSWAEPCSSISTASSFSTTRSFTVAVPAASPIDRKTEQKPDLVVESARFTKDEKGRIRAALAFKNAGNGIATAPDLAIEILGDSAAKGQIVNYPFFALGSGESVNTETILDPLLINEGQTVRIKIDATSIVNESDEANNELRAVVKLEACSASAQYDQNGDGKTNESDINVCAMYFNQAANSESSKCDFNGDCRIDSRDSEIHRSKIAANIVSWETVSGISTRDSYNNIVVFEGGVVSSVGVDAQDIDVVTAIVINGGEPHVCVRAHGSEDGACAIITQAAAGQPVKVVLLEKRNSGYAWQVLASRDLQLNGDMFSIRLAAKGDKLAVKAWVEGESEPADWLSIVDSPARKGGVVLKAAKSGSPLVVFSPPEIGFDVSEIGAVPIRVSSNWAAVNGVWNLNENNVLVATDLGKDAHAILRFDGDSFRTGETLGEVALTGSSSNSMEGGICHIGYCEGNPNTNCAYCIAVNKARGHVMALFFDNSFNPKVVAEAELPSSLFFDEKKLSLKVKSGNVYLKGKVWPAGELEPAEWNVVVKKKRIVTDLRPAYYSFTRYAEFSPGVESSNTCKAQSGCNGEWDFKGGFWEVSDDGKSVSAMGISDPLFEILNNNYDARDLDARGVFSADDPYSLSGLLCLRAQEKNEDTISPAYCVSVKGSKAGYPSHYISPGSIDPENRLSVNAERFHVSAIFKWHDGFFEQISTPFVLPDQGAKDFNVRFAANGNRIAAKVWPRWSAEPSDWSVIAEESQNNALGSGKLGVLSLESRSGFSFALSSVSLDAPQIDAPPEPVVTLSADKTSVFEGDTVSLKVNVENSNPNLKPFFVQVMKIDSQQRGQVMEQKSCHSEKECSGDYKVKPKETSSFVAFISMAKKGGEQPVVLESEPVVVNVVPFKASVTPDKAQVGTMFSLNVQAPHGASVAYLIYPAEGGGLGETYNLPLFLSEQGDGNYVASAQMEAAGLFFVDVTVTTGNVERQFKKAASFTVSEPSTECVPLINNGNGPDKVDVVFVPNHYSADDLKAIEAGLISEHANAILSKEPFKSSANRFNFWYLKQVNGVDCTLNAAQNCYNFFKKSVSSACSFHDQIIVLEKESLVNAGGYSFGIVSGFLVVGTASYSLSHEVTVHEFGHSFGGLADEYVSLAEFSKVDGPNCDRFGCPKWCSGPVSSYEPLCYALNDKAACESKSYTYSGRSYNCIWNEAIGPSTEGSKGICDFPSDTGVNFGFDCKANTGCYYQCGGKGGYKSAPDSIMADSKVGQFNRVSQEYIQYILDCKYRDTSLPLPARCTKPFGDKTEKAQPKKEGCVDLAPLLKENGVQILVTKDVKLCPGEYKFGGTALVMESDNIVIDCNGASLAGTNMQGYGIYNKGHSNIEIRNCKLSGFFFGIYSDGGDNIRILNNDISENYVLQDYGTFLQVGYGPYDPYGGGIYLKKSKDSRIEGNLLNRQQDGMELYWVSDSFIVKNDASHNYGWGIKMYGSSNNEVSDNDFSYVNRYCSKDSPSQLCKNAGFISSKIGCGCDSAGILMVAKSNNNRIIRNNLQYGGDGFFLRGDEYVGGPSEDNYIAYNDASFSPHNAFESTFSGNNQFFKNTAEESNYGFWLGYSHDNELTENTIINNAKMGIAVENGRDNVIDGNTIAGSPTLISLEVNKNAVRGYEAVSMGYKVKDNTLRDGAVGISLVTTTDSEIINNKIYSTSQPFKEIDTKNIVNKDNTVEPVKKG